MSVHAALSGRPRRGAKARWGEHWRGAGQIACVLMLGLWWLASLAATVEAEPQAIEPLNLGRWVSQLWEPIAAYGGLLTDDEREDVVVVLHRQDAIADDALLPVGSRGLAIFSLTPDGTYRREAQLEGVLPCVQCLGTVNRDPRAVPFEIDIADRQLTVSWIGNPNGFVFVRLVFAWEPARQAFGLIADEVVRTDPESGRKSRRVRDFRTGQAVTDGQVSDFAPRFMPAEEIKARDYEERSR